MAKMYPSKIEWAHGDVPLAERNVFEKLKELPENNCIIWGLPWAAPNGSKRVNRSRQALGEADFVIIDTQRRGFLVLEVKGGRGIRQTPDGWESLPHNRPDWVRIKDPVRQVRDTAGALRDILRKQGNTVRFACGLIFPGMYFTGQIAGMEPECVVDSRRLNEGKLSAIVGRMFDMHGIARSTVNVEFTRNVLESLINRILTQEVKIFELGFVRT